MKHSSCHKGCNSVSNHILKFRLCVVTIRGTSWFFYYSFCYARKQDTGTQHKKGKC